jgi:fibro-slime domain-containing protein
MSAPNTAPAANQMPPASDQTPPASNQTPPADFTPTELGGYKLGDPLTANGAPPDNAGPRDPMHCNVMLAVVRDFKGAAEPGGHPDFEIFDGKGPTGLLGPMLNVDRTPSYASRCEANFDKASCRYGQMTTSQERFEQWYHDVDGVNLPYLLQLAFVSNAGVYTFQSNGFYPLDANGFGNTPKRKHNFSFTTELHTRFRYSGGETFSFTGDDDLWVYVNDRLAIDLGGLHPPASAKLDLDSAAPDLQLTLGDEYPLDLFHAERHSANSNFRVDTSIEFTECGTVISVF